MTLTAACPGSSTSRADEILAVVLRIIVHVVIKKMKTVVIKIDLQRQLPRIYKVSQRYFWGDALVIIRREVMEDGNGVLEMCI